MWCANNPTSLQRFAVGLAERFVRWRGAARSKGALHQDAVGPAPVFESDGLEQAGLLEPERLVQALRWYVGDVDIGDHLTTAGSGAGVDQRRQQTPANAGIEMIRVHVNGVLHRVAVGRTFSERHRIGVADHGPLVFGDQMRQAMFRHVLAAPFDVVAVKRFEVEFAEAALDVVGIDGKHGRHVVIGQRTNDDVDRFLSCRVAARQ
jgi:hypothetical protein